MKQLILKDLVSDTYTNIAGASLAIQLIRLINDNVMIELSFSNSTPLSSSFFNSSFGQLIEDFGYSKVKDCIKLVGVNNSQGKLLRDYFDAYKKYDHC